MKTVHLGRTGLSVSQVCLGTMTFDREADSQTSFEIMDAFVDAGGFFVDTANVYSSGAAESVVGNWMSERKNRQQIVLATKVFGPMGEGPNDRGLSRRHILSAVDDSLRRLKTDWIDLYQIHRKDPRTPVEETVRALDDLVKQGKIRYLGASNLKGFELAEFLWVARSMGLERMVSYQPAYNALNRAIELELMPLCSNEGVALIPYNPLAGGVLTGKYLESDELPEGSRMAVHEFYRKRYLTEKALDVTRKFVRVAAERSISPAALALAWVVAEPRVTAPIVGARSVKQLKDTLDGVDHELSWEDRQLIPALNPGRWVGEDPVYDRSH